MSVEVHALTNNPTEAWRELSGEQKVCQIQIPAFQGNPRDGMIRLVCMSDTHSMTSRMKFNVPDGDIFIHAGDFTKFGMEEEVIEFNTWLGRLPHTHKLVIAGNHEFSFDPTFTYLYSPSIVENIRSILTNCIYLEDASVVIEGLKFYGTPWQPEHQDSAFNLPRGELCLEKWNLIPSDTDILITHGPPLGHGDLTIRKIRAGCVELLSTVRQRIKPRYHIFGHIHEGYGITTDNRNSHTWYINASTCNVKYQPVNLPIILDIEKAL